MQNADFEKIDALAQWQAGEELYSYAGASLQERTEVQEHNRRVQAEYRRLLRYYRSNPTAMADDWREYQRNGDDEE